LYFTELSYIGNGEVQISNYNNSNQQNRCKVFEEKNADKIFRSETENETSGWRKLKYTKTSIIWLCTK
jgi:hypothetical protein